MNASQESTIPFPGREVSCRGLVLYLKKAKQENCLAELMKEIPYSSKHLHNKFERVSWEAYCSFLENAKHLWGEEALVQIGRRVLKVPVFRPFFALMGFIRTPLQFYLFAASDDLAIRNAFSCVNTAMAQEIEGNVKMVFEIAPGFRNSPEYFLQTLGVLESIPGLVGYRGAHATMEQGENQCTFHITYDLKTLPWSRLTRVKSWLLNSQAIASQIRENMEELNARNFALEKEIADRKKIEQQLQLIQSEQEKLIQELQRKNRDLEQFTYTVSHELKSPLVTIRGFMGLVREDIELKNIHQAEKDLQRIDLAADQMKDLLDDLLYLSRMGREAFEPQRIHTEGVIREVLELLDGPITSRKVLVAVQETFPAVYGDSTQLKEVFLNLIENGIKFMGDEPSPRLDIGHEETQKHPSGYFFVQDNGIGILPRYHETVFGLFDRLDKDNPGSGIGLAIVRRIIENHNGEVWIESEGEQTGTKVCFTLPIVSNR